MNIWEFIIGVSLISTLGWVANNWVRARHGYPLEEENEEAPRKKELNWRNGWR
jgi:hypothetical protein